MPTITQVHFASQHMNMRVVRRIAVEQIVNGQVRVTEPELAYEFKNGNLFVADGQDTLADRLLEDGQVVEQDAATFLRNHEDHGIRFTEIVPVAPDAGPLYAEIAQAVVKGDVAALDAIAQEEFDTWNRPEVMDLLRDAVDKLEPKE